MLELGGVLEHNIYQNHTTDYTVTTDNKKRKIPEIPSRGRRPPQQQTATQLKERVPL